MVPEREKWTCAWSKSYLCWQICKYLNIKKSWINIIVCILYFSWTNIAFNFLHKDNRSHGWIPLTSMEAIAYKLEEGNDYIISNFSVQPFSLKYRCFEAEFHIVLHKNTDITLLRTSTSVIPRDVFYFTNLRSLTTNPVDIACLIGKKSLFLVTLKYPSCVLH